jgi:hypothetical protein
MKLAEALSERKAIKTRMEDLKQRIHRNAQTQEGEPPHEEPDALIDALSEETMRFALLVARINAVNAAATLPSGETLASAILRRDMLRYLHLTCQSLADKATPVRDRYSHREIKTVPSVEVARVRRRADELAKAARLLDLELQEANWRVELS